MSTEIAQAYAVAVAPLAPGEVLAGRYRLKEVIGLGAHSTVYLALDERLSVEGAPAHVAVKVSQEPMAAYEFNRVQRIDHPNVVALRDRGSHQGLHFLVSDYIAGEDLSTLAGAGPRRTALLMASVARGVAAAHARGVSHGDLKPANILMAEHGPVVADFGGGRTATYTAPEGGEPTPAGDIWSLGIMLAELARDAPAGLRRVMEQAQHPDPQQRPTASQLADRLEAWVQRRPAPYERTGPLRRLGLWVVRSPYQFATLVLALLIAFETGAAWQYVDVESQRRAQLQTEAAVGELKADMRGTVGGWARTLMWLGARTQDQITAHEPEAGWPSGQDAAARGEAEDPGPEHGEPEQGSSRRGGQTDG